MKNVSIIVPYGAAVVNCIEGSYVLFNKANDFLQSLGREPLFKIRLVGVTAEQRAYDRFFSVTPDATIKDNFQSDLIIIPAVNGDMKHVMEINKGFNEWIVSQHAAGSEVASLCVGTFLLAATGLLNGKKCATHWMAVNEFRNLFPDIDLVSEKIITDEKGVYSSGGANSFWNLLLYLLEKYAGRDVSIMAAKYFAIEIDRTAQTSFIIFKGQTNHNDEAVKKVQDFIEKNFQDKITVDQLSQMFAMGRRSFERRFKKATCNTITEYIQRVKIEAAKKSFETSRKNISEVMYEIGYSDTKAFRTVFKRATGMSPVDYRNKYNREAFA